MQRLCLLARPVGCEGVHERLLIAFDVDTAD
jgi:hypothetical protein